jgi:uncharacterized integral membrane protein
MARGAAIFIALVLGLALHARNHAPVTLDFYVLRAQMPLSWALVAALGLGGLLGMLAMLPRLLGATRALRRERRRAARDPGKVVAPPAGVSSDPPPPGAP